MKNKFKLLYLLTFCFLWGMSSCEKDEVIKNTALQGTWELKKMEMKFYINDTLYEQDTLQDSLLIANLGRINWEFKGDNDVFERFYRGSDMQTMGYRYTLSDNTLTLVPKTTPASESLVLNNYNNTGSEFSGETKIENNMGGMVYKSIRKFVFQKI